MKEENRWEAEGVVIPLDTSGDDHRFVKLADMTLMRLAVGWRPWPFSQPYRYRCTHNPTRLYTIADTERDAIDQLILDVHYSGML